MTKKHLLITRESALQKLEEFGGNQRKAARELGIPRSTFRDLIKRTPKKAENIRRFLITYGQNDTPVHEGFFKSAMNWCKMNKGELIVYAGKYRNPTSPHEADKQNPSWDLSIKPYLLDSERTLNDNLIIYPARTQPTAVRPLSGYETHTRHRSGIFPHPKIQLKTVPTPGHMMPKILASTGAITIKNYSKSKAGEKGKWHHILGACLVEVEDDKVFHLRHINATKDGSFYDIAGGKVKHYTPDEVETVNEIDTYVMGDLHYPFVDEEALNGSLSFLNKVKTKRLVIHDAIDHWARNHHTINDRFLNSAKDKSSLMEVEKEIDGICELFKNKLCNPKKYETLIVPSNHNDALGKWLKEADINDLGVNAAYFHWLSYNVHKSAKLTPYGFSFVDPLEFALKEKINTESLGIRFLKRDKAEIHLDIGYNFHGDIGPSGSRGSAMNLSKIGIKTVIGHSHAPAIVDSCYQVGVKSIIPLGYAKDSPSAWLHTDCITYNDGKRTLINYINGKCYL